MQRGLFRCLREGRADHRPLRPVYPKDADAPICACFGLTRQDIERDVQEGVVTRVKAILAKANSAEARTRMAANGCSCVPYVQKYYMQCRAIKPGEGTR